MAWLIGYIVLFACLGFMVWAWTDSLLRLRASRATRRALREAQKAAKGKGFRDGG